MAIDLKQDTWTLILLLRVVFFTTKEGRSVTTGVFPRKVSNCAKERGGNYRGYSHGGCPWLRMSVIRRAVFDE